MKVRVRTLSNEEVEIEAEPENGEKVVSLKEKIEKQWSHMPASRQRLVHAGKVLGDAQLLSDTSIKEGDRIVVMLTKAHPAAAAASAGTGTSTSSSSSSSSTSTAAGAAAQPLTASLSPGNAAGAAGSTTNPAAANSGTAAASSSAAAGAAKQETATRSEERGGGGGATGTGAGGAVATEGAAARGGSTSEEAAAGTSSSSSSSHPPAESVLQTGPQLEETLEQLVAMGFPRDRAEQAMRAAFNNPNRAVEYLMNGLPQDVSALLGMGGGLPSGDGDAAAAAAAAAEELQQAAGDAEDDEGLAAEEEEAAADSSNPLAALRRHPAFSQIRQMVQANPAMLPQVLQLIGSSNPQLLELITQNQDAFLEVLQQDDADEGAAQQQQQGGAGGNILGAVPGSGVVQITRDEMEALQRLEALGFTRHQAVEAYLACDRDEEMAANFLLENINDLEGDGSGAGSGAAE